MKNGMKHLVVLTSATVTALTMVGCGQMAPSAQLAGSNGVNFNAAAAPGEIVVKFAIGIDACREEQVVGRRCVELVALEFQRGIAGRRR